MTAQFHNFIKIHGNQIQFQAENSRGGKFEIGEMSEVVRDDAIILCFRGRFFSYFHSTWNKFEQQRDDAIPFVFVAVFYSLCTADSVLYVASNQRPKKEKKFPCRRGSGQIIN